jgi:hypothetical protein
MVSDPRAAIEAKLGPLASFEIVGHYARETSFANAPALRYQSDLKRSAMRESKNSAPNARKKRGPKSRYTPELAERICSELACGKSLRTVCKKPGTPPRGTIFSWLRTNPDFRELYDRAKAESADAIFEEILDIADDGRNDWMETFNEKGESIGWKLNGEAVQRSRVRIDARKWIVSKLLPRKYGDKLDLNHGVQPDDPLAKLIQAVQGRTLGPVPTRAIEHENGE